MTSIPVNICFEDRLSEAIIEKLLTVSGRDYHVGKRLSRGGYGYLRRIAPGLNAASRGTPCLMLTDLDQSECPPSVISDWFNGPLHSNFIFLIAVREVEAWLIADRLRLARFFGVDRSLIPADPENLVNPKEHIINVARRSKNRSLRNDICPPIGSSRVQGASYNDPMSRFVDEKWNPIEAMNNSASLKRAVEVISTFVPNYK